MILIKEIPKPETNKYKSWNTSKWGLYKCPVCNNEFEAPIYGVENKHIKTCGCIKGKKGGNTLRKFWKHNNKHPNATYLTFNNETLNLSEWSKKTGIPRSTIIDRKNKDLPIEEIFKEYINDNK